MRFWKQIYFVSFFTTIIKCDHKEEIKSKNSLSYFRRKVEEQSEEHSIESRDSDNSKTNLVSFLVNNIKEIFNDIDDVTEIYKFSNTTSTVPPEIVRQTNIFIIKTTEEDPKITDYVMVYENMSQSTLKNLKFDTGSPSYDKQIIEQQALYLMSKDKKSLEKSDQTFNDNKAPSINSLAMESTDLSEARESGRSCIFCNNVMSEECNNPRNKLITSILCKSVDDLCYSQHTPFGIVDRGCFNLNRNLTTYVCACNLCNHISISQMPHFFSNKLDWVDNIVELSRARNVRKSVFKDMACLRCEANPKKKSHFIESSHCLEGNIGSLPTQICEESEVCAVKAIKGEGYIWRGCVRAPLYNYWWTVCDSDLCNYDSLVSIYDFV